MKSIQQRTIYLIIHNLNNNIYTNKSINQLLLLLSSSINTRYSLNTVIMVHISFNRFLRCFYCYCIIVIVMLFNLFLIILYFNIVFILFFYFVLLIAKTQFESLARSYSSYLILHNEAVRFSVFAVAASTSGISR